MQIKNICGNTGYISTKHALITTYSLSNEEVILFDSGETESQELLNLLEENHLRVRAVFCTHLHPDHTANNCILNKRHGAEIYHPNENIPEYTKQYRKEYPFRTLIHSKKICINNADILILPAPGHSAGHLSYVTPDGVCCVGDALLSQPILRHSKLPYMENVELAVSSMEQIRKMDFSHFVVAHKAVVSRNKMSELVDENIQKERDLSEILCRCIGKSSSVETIVTDFMHSIGIERTEVIQSEYLRDLIRMRIQSYSMTKASD